MAALASPSPVGPGILAAPSAASAPRPSRTARIGSFARAPRAPFAWAAVGATGLLAFYLGLITVAQGWGHAVEQLAADRWFVAAIMAGFGTQVGLFVHLRHLHAEHARHATAVGGVAASTGTSAAAMLACCAHHLTDVFAVLGLSGAAVFLTTYKLPLLWLGIAMNLAGIGLMLREVAQARRVAATAAAGTACH